MHNELVLTDVVDEENLRKEPIGPLQNGLVLRLKSLEGQVSGADLRQPDMFVIGDFVVVWVPRVRHGSA